MNILLLLAHSIAEYDDLRMFSDLGYNVFSIGAYIDPANPGDDKRPALPNVRAYPDLHALVPDQMAAKEHLPEAIIEWADVIIAHHYVDSWLAAQWPRIRHKLVIWRTCGQSDLRLEDVMRPLRDDGLRIVRYSPAERTYFEPTGHWAGQDAMIRFGKYLSDYHGWTGDGLWVGNITQDMAGRGEWCGYTYWLRATHGLDAAPAGPGSEKMPGGKGVMSYPAMLDYLRQCRAYLYTGTMPAPYTLGLVEAMLTGSPVVSIGREAWMGPDALFEAASMVPHAFDDPSDAWKRLATLLRDRDEAVYLSGMVRQVARLLFDIKTIGPQWVRLLGDPKPDSIPAWQDAGSPA